MEICYYFQSKEKRTKENKVMGRYLRRMSNYYNNYSRVMSEEDIPKILEKIKNKFDASEYPKLEKICRDRIGKQSREIDYSTKSICDVIDSGIKKIGIENPRSVLRKIDDHISYFRRYEKKRNGDFCTFGIGPAPENPFTN